MKAVTVTPGTAGSVRLEEVPEPDLSQGSVLVEALADVRLGNLFQPYRPGHAGRRCHGPHPILPGCRIHPQLPYPPTDCLAGGPRGFTHRG